MAQETLKLVITADNADALAKIKQFSESLGAQTKEWEKNKKATGDATNVLTNFSRLAEDSAYGLRGAANNINPFIESFKRLKDETGSTKAALASMAQGLIGPAGILVAVSTISTILISYADNERKAAKEAEELSKANKNGAQSIKEKKEALDQLYASTAKEVTEVTSLIAVLQNENETRNRKIKALEALKKINPEIFGALQLEKGAVDGLNAAYEKYISNLSSVIAVKIKQKELEQITEEILKKQGVTLTQEAKDIAETGKLLKDSANTRKTDLELRQLGIKETVKQRKEENELNGLLERRKKIFADITELSKNVEVPNEYDKPKAPKKAKDLLNQNEITDLLRARYKSDSLLTPLEKAPEDTAIEDAKQQYEDYLKWLSKQTKWKEKLASANIKKEQKDLEELQKSYEKFAETIAGTVTNALFTMYDAIQQGENPLQAIGQMFANIARQIAAAVVQALIFQALLEAFPALKGAFAALGTVNSALGIGKGMSALNSGVSSSSTFNSNGIASVGNQTNGQFVIKGNDLVLALQRSNSSLNLIRG